jgi:hypothetical protein
LHILVLGSADVMAGTCQFSCCRAVLKLVNIGVLTSALLCAILLTSKGRTSTRRLSPLKGQPTMSSNSIDMGTHYTVTADAESMALYNAMQESAAKYDAAIKAFAPARDALLAMQKAGIRKGLKAAKLAYDEGWFNLNDARVDMEEAQRVWVADFHAKYRTVTVTE